MQQELEINNKDKLCEYEMVIATENYFKNQNSQDWKKRIISDIVLFKLLLNESKASEIRSTFSGLAFFNSSFISSNDELGFFS